MTAFVDILRENEANPVLVQLFGLLSAERIREDHPAHEYFVTRYQQLVEVTTDALRDTVDEDALPEGATTETVARRIIGAADGIRLQWLLDPSSMGRADALALLNRSAATVLQGRGAAARRRSSCIDLLAAVRSADWPTPTPADRA